ncbi:MAG: peptidoglycan-binding domain-containing protein [Stellaceae bacterium]
MYNGFTHLAVDGVRGPSSSEAVRQFQRSIGVEPSGNIDSR